MKQGDEKMKFYRIVDRESTNPNLSSNGGDYDFGRTVAVEGGKPIAVRFWTSADFSYCPHSGQFQECDDICDDNLSQIDIEVMADGWQNGQPLESQEAETREFYRLSKGQFAMIEDAKDFCTPKRPATGQFVAAS